MKTIHLIPAVLLLLSSAHVYCQEQSYPDSTAVNNSVLTYQKEMKLQSWLYNGIEELGYGANVIGNPYFSADSLVAGSLVYEGNRYRDVFMMYDMIKDALVIKYLETPLRIRLLRDKINSFDLSGHHFILISAKNSYRDLKEGFYDQIYTGNIQFLVKRSALSNAIIEDTRVKYRIDAKSHYYFIKDNIAIPVNSIKSALKVTGDKDHRIKMYLKKNKLKYRKNPEDVLLKIALLNDEFTRNN